MPTIRNGRGIREAFTVDLVGAPSGPITVRRADPAEVDGFAPRRPSPGLYRVPRRVTPVTAAPLEEPVMAVPTPAPKPAPSAVPTSTHRDLPRILPAPPPDDDQVDDIAERIVRAGHAALDAFLAEWRGAIAAAELAPAAPEPAAEPAPVFATVDVTPAAPPPPRPARLRPSEIRLLVGLAATGGDRDATSRALGITRGSVDTMCAIIRRRPEALTPAEIALVASTRRTRGQR